MYYLLQSGIIFAVVVSNIEWQWTPNGYIPAMLGIGLAYGITGGLNYVLERWARHPHGL